MAQKNLDNLRHSAAHLLAAAVLELYPNALLTIGPPINTGFYYDIDFKKPISETDLQNIEEKMHEIVKTWKYFEHKEVSLFEAKKLFKNNPYKLEIIDDLTKKGKKITIVTSGKFTDLCEGGHIKNPSSTLKYFKLLSISGAYWRGDEKNKMLTRIYGTAFYSEKELIDFLNKLEESKIRDHRKIGKDLDLFTFSPLIGAGLPLFTPKGALLRRIILDFVESLQNKEGYTQVWTPQISKAELFKKSGHYEKYKKDMFRVISNYSDEEFYLKPMNCPQHTQIYASQPRSYRDLPLRYTDFAMLYRDEKPGELNGLGRVRSFSQDDCHVFCTPEQIEDEVGKMLAMIKTIMNAFGMKYKYRLSTRDPKHPENYLGDPAIWDQAEKLAVKIMKRNKVEYFEAPGEAAFYAPKMDLIATDALSREWQISTIQIDFIMPQRFELTYIDKDGISKTPVMLHRAMIGSPERFIMILLEQYKGALPFWLSPVQVAILPVGESYIDYANQCAKILYQSNIRTEINTEAKTISYKIRIYTLQKVPYICIIGGNETKMKDGLFCSVRTREGKNLGLMRLDKLISILKNQFVF